MLFSSISRLFFLCSLTSFLIFSAVMIPLYHYQHKHPHNFVFLGLFTLCLSFSIGVACANTQGLSFFSNSLICFSSRYLVVFFGLDNHLLNYRRENRSGGFSADGWRGGFSDCVCLLGVKEGQGIRVPGAYPVFRAYYPRPN